MTLEKYWLPKSQPCGLLHYMWFTWSCLNSLVHFKHENMAELSAQAVKMVYSNLVTISQGQFYTFGVTGVQGVTSHMPYWDQFRKFLSTNLSSFRHFTRYFSTMIKSLKWLKDLYQGLGIVQSLYNVIRGDEKTS